MNFWGVIEVYFKCLDTKFQREILKLPGAVPIRSWAVPSNTCIFSMILAGGVVRKVSKNGVWVNLLSENNNAINSAFFGVLWVINWAFKRSIILVFAQLESKLEVGKKGNFIAIVGFQTAAAIFKIQCWNLVYKHLKYTSITPKKFIKFHLRVQKCCTHWQKNSHFFVITR